MSVVSAARKATFQILLAVERGKGHSDDLLRDERISALSAPDRNLTTTLVLGVLRWQLLLDQRLQAHLNRPKAKLDPEVLVALRLGAFQLLHLDRIPARAAIDQSVELTKQAGHRFASGMVNAVLRKVAASKDQAPVSVENAETVAHPSWMVDRWTRFFGHETACAICLHGQAQPALAIRIVDPKAEEELVHAGVELGPGALLTSARMVLSGEVTATNAFREGRVRIQDEGSQLIAEIVGKGDTILDCCAAPGGKTLVLAERNPATRMVACETSPQRFEALRQRLAPLGSRIECRLADASSIREVDAFDLVLADVPCSGTGTLGRNPEIRHRLRPEDIGRQAERQCAILSTALRAARVGGRVVYSTCSLEPEEDEQVIAAVLQRQEAEIVPLGLRIDEMVSEGILQAECRERLRRSMTAEGFLRLIPGVCATDGFFVAMLQKRG